LDTLSSDVILKATVMGVDPLVMNANMERQLLTSAGHSVGVGGGFSVADIERQNQSIVDAVARGDSRVTPEGLRALEAFQNAALQGAFEREIAEKLYVQGLVPSNFVWSQTWDDSKGGYEWGVVYDTEKRPVEYSWDAFVGGMVKSGYNAVLFHNPAWAASNSLKYEALSFDELSIFKTTGLVTGAVLAAPVVAVGAGATTVGAGLAAVGKAAVVGVGLSQGVSTVSAFVGGGVSWESLRGSLLSPVEVVEAAATGVLFAGASTAAFKAASYIAPKIGSAIGKALPNFKLITYERGTGVPTLHDKGSAARELAKRSTKFVSSVGGQVLVAGGLGGVVGGVFGGSGYVPVSSVVDGVEVTENRFRLGFDWGSAAVGATVGAGMVLASHALSQGYKVLSGRVGKDVWGKSVWKATETTPTTKYGKSLEVKVWETKAVKAFVNRTIRILGAHTEAGIGSTNPVTGTIVTPKTLAKDIGVSNTFTHATRSQKIPTSADKSILLKGVPDSANLTKSAYQWYPFYGAPGIAPNPSTGEPGRIRVYGAYGGIGDLDNYLQVFGGCL
jgi:hypothetical protein